MSSPKNKIVQFKIIYWGPGEAGKTTNFHCLKALFPDNLISKGFSIETSEHRTLWNDSIHFEFHLDHLHMDLIIILGTTTGQERFLSTREYILQNADGVVFVADSDPEKMEENIRSFDELHSFIGNSKTPLLILLNKRDLPNAIKLKKFRKEMNLPEEHLDSHGFKTVYESVAVKTKESGDVESVFLDLLQQIVTKYLSQNC